MLNMTNFDAHLAAAANGVEREHVNINGTDNPARLIDILERLEMCSAELAVPLKKIAASGGELKEFLQIPVHKLDARLRNTDATVEQRMALKSSLSRHGMLFVQR